MAVIQPTFEISDLAAAGLAVGEYVRTGGVIREASTGHIVEHLKDTFVNGKVSSSSAILETVDFANDVAKLSTRVEVKDGTRISLGNKIAVGTLVVAVVYGSYKLITYLKKQNEENKQIQVTNENNDVIEYNLELTGYFNNVQTQSMTLDSIKDVSRFFETYSNGDKEIEITDEEMKVMRNLIVRYTIKLCKANKIKLKNIELNSEINIKNHNDLLAEILYATKIQEEIFTIA